MALEAEICIPDETCSKSEESLFFFLLSSASRALTRVCSGRPGAGDSARAPGGGTGSFRFVTSGFPWTFFGDYGFTKEDLYHGGKTMQKNPSGIFCWKPLAAPGLE